MKSTTAPHSLLPGISGGLLSSTNNPALNAAGGWPHTRTCVRVEWTPRAIAGFPVISRFEVFVVGSSLGAFEPNFDSQRKHNRVPYRGRLNPVSG